MPPVTQGGKRGRFTPHNRGRRHGMIWTQEGHVDTPAHMQGKGNDTAGKKGFKSTFSFTQTRLWNDSPAATTELQKHRVSKVKLSQFLATRLDKGPSRERLSKSKTAPLKRRRRGFKSPECPSLPHALEQTRTLLCRSTDTQQTIVSLGQLVII